MAKSGISQLDRKSIAVSFEVNGEVVYVAGVGEFYRDPLLGNCLRVAVDDGLFELIFREVEFSQPVLPGAEFGCEFFIPLTEARRSKAV